MVAVVDYGVGNLFSLTCSLCALGEEALVSGSAQEILAADRVILPGVGAFGDAADKLRALSLDNALREVAARGTPLLGICLGMQLLFERSEEYGTHAGLGFIPGRVAPLRGALPEDAVIPHMGWNALTITDPPCPLLAEIREGDFVYFVHSFYAVECAANTAATTSYGVTIPALVQKKNIFGAQFHPEKSGPVGLKILHNFCKNVKQGREECGYFQ